MCVGLLQPIRFGHADYEATMLDGIYWNEASVGKIQKGELVRVCTERIITIIMNILISNDDGWLAPGIAALASAVQPFANIKVVAPDKNRSAASNSLTLTRPLRAIQHKPDWYSVDGTPADCVNLALNGLLDWSPDIVISGINAGPNLGDDVVYSGTVAAAMEGYFHNLPAMAFSLADVSGGYEVAAQIAADLIKPCVEDGGKQSSIVNVNLPNIAVADSAKLTVTRLGLRSRKGAKRIEQKDPRGETIYWIGPVGTPQDAGEGTDFHAIASGEVSITPLSYDMTSHDRIAPLSKTLSGGAV